VGETGVVLRNVKIHGECQVDGVAGERGIDGDES
jgi:hypothetical protein